MKLPEELLHKSRVKVSGIYQITNIVNSKKYIGSSDHLYRRFSDHVRYLERGNHSNPRLQNSWSKYGREKFVFQVLEYVADEFLVETEQWYIDTFQPELNISKVVGYPSTPKAGSIEAKLRAQKAMEARENSEWYNSKELREIMSEKKKRTWEDPEYRNQRVEETKLLWQDPEYRTKLSDVHKKIKDGDRQRVREMHNSGVATRYELSGIFGVSYATINRILKEAT